MANTDLRTLPTHVTTVIGVRAISPLVRRFTFGGGGLERLAPVGPDSFLYLLLPPPGRDELTIGTDFSWEAYREMSEALRPVGAYYTIRHHRPADGEIDVDVVLHGDDGPASRWALEAGPGAPVALWGPRTMYAPPEGTDSFLLVADDTGVPAVSAIVETLPASSRARVILEVADVREEQPLSSQAALQTTWLHRDGAPAGTTTALVDATRSLPVPSPSTYVWGASESRIATAIRQHARDEWGLARERRSLTPYWRHADSPLRDPDDD